MTYGDLRESILRREVERGIALVLEVWVPQVVRIVAHDALYEGEVVEEDGAAEPSRHVDPGLMGSISSSSAPPLCG